MNGDLYVGDMKDDFFDGHGVLTYAFGDRYEGQFKRGKPYGRGRYEEEHAPLINHYNYYFSV